MGDGGEGDGVSAVMGGGDGCVGSGGVNETDCCRLPMVIQELLGRPPTQFPILFQIPSQ